MSLMSLIYTVYNIFSIKFEDMRFLFQLLEIICLKKIIGIRR